ncbi:hypothetical protein ACFX2I_013356 [Malus domestica]
MEPQCFSVVGSMAKLTSFTILLFLLSCSLLLLQIRDLRQSVEHVQDRAREVDLDASSSPTTNQFLGISPQNEKCYKSSEIIKCKDGSKKFSRAQLNDNFCDCPDGTTSLALLLIFSSRVNDGIYGNVSSSTREL